MKRKRYSVEQITVALQQHEAGLSIEAITRKLGIAEQTFYRWKKQYGGLQLAEARELKQLREENTKLKKVVDEISLDKAMLQDVVKKWVKTGQRRQVARYLHSHYPVSERRARAAICLSRSVHRYRSVRPPQDALRRRIRDIAATRVRYGYRRTWVLLRREGVRINPKRVYRLYCEEGLTSRAKRPRRHVSAAHRQPVRHLPTQPNQVWSMDFVADQLHGGIRFRALTVIDVFIRECLAIRVGQKLGGEDVIQTLTTISTQRSVPKRIFCDNGSEFQGRLVDMWAYQNRVSLEFSRPGKPTDNAHIELFNGCFRDECLNTHWFSTLDDARVTIETWRREYNESRPHRSLNHLSPEQYAVLWTN